MIDDLRAALEPRTEAGRALLKYAKGLPPLFLTPAWHEGILAIEAEAVALATSDGLDVDRLARAIASAGVHVDVRDPLVRSEPCESCARGVRVIAREYAALRSTPEAE